MQNHLKKSNSVIKKKIQTNFMNKVVVLEQAIMVILQGMVLQNMNKQLKFLVLIKKALYSDFTLSW